MDREIEMTTKKVRDLEPGDVLALDNDTTAAVVRVEPCRLVDGNAREVFWEGGSAIASPEDRVELAG